MSTFKIIKINIIILIFFIFTLLITGCSTEKFESFNKESDFYCVGGIGGDKWQSLPVSVETRYNEEIEFIDDLNELIGFDLFTDLPNDDGRYDIEILYVANDDLATVENKDTKGISITTCKDSFIFKSYVRLDEELIDNKEEWKYFFTHELGHSIGFGHINNTIMQNPVIISDFDDKTINFIDNFVFDLYPEIEN